MNREKSLFSCCFLFSCSNAANTSFWVCRKILVARHYINTHDSSGTRASEMDLAGYAWPFSAQEGPVWQEKLANYMTFNAELVSTKVTGQSWRDAQHESTGKGQPHCSCHDTPHFMLEENWGNMRLNEPGRQWLDRRKSWQRTKHDKLLTYLTLDSKRMGPKFLLPWYPTEGEGSWKTWILG